jgi:hypothetical protein
MWQLDWPSQHPLHRSVALQFAWEHWCVPVSHVSPGEQSIAPLHPQLPFTQALPLALGPMQSMLPPQPHCPATHAAPAPDMVQLAQEVPQCIASLAAAHVFELATQQTPPAQSDDCAHATHAPLSHTGCAPPQLVHAIPFVPHAPWSAPPTQEPPWQQPVPHVSALLHGAHA